MDGSLFRVGLLFLHGGRFNSALEIIKTLTPEELDTAIKIMLQKLERAGKRFK